MAQYVNSTAGRVAVASLGRTLIHEHVMVGFPGFFMDSRQPPFKRQDVLVRVVDAFNALHAYGVRTVVDPCPMDMGRDVEMIAEVSQRTGIQLICATGAYTEKQGIPFLFRQLDVGAITDIYIKEIEDGVGATGIRAGVVKIATDDGVVTEYERKLLTAAARAAKATGVPLISHTENSTCGQEQIDIVTGEGVAASRLLVGHSDCRDDHDYQRAIAERGAYVGFDRFGIEYMLSDSVRVKNLKKLVDCGHRDRILVSHDTVACFLGGVPGVPEDVSKILPNSRLTYLFESIIPQLKGLGMTDVELEEILADNPRRFFGGPNG